MAKRKQCMQCMTGFANVAAVAFALGACSALADTLPSPADPSRIEPLDQQSVPERPPAKIVIPEVKSSITVPDAAKQLTFTLQRVKIDGVTAFTENEVAKIYQPYLNRDVPLASLWMIAGQISQLYQDKGYFLSRAYVPAQEIEGGTVSINVVEGYIAEVDIEDKAFAKHRLTQAMVERIKAEKPISAYDLESFMLQMKALPGNEFRAFVEPIKDADAGVTRLSLRSAGKTGRGSVSFDNFGSRFLGPYQATVTYQDSFLPLQETTLSALATTPSDELKYAAFRHKAAIYPDWTVELSGNYVIAAPGASLKPNDITSESVNLGIGISWQPIRQRQENLIASLEFTGRNTNSYIHDDNPLTRDRIRAARGRLSYDTSDRWNGYNYITIGINQGLEVLGASDKGDLYLSRAGAEPDFTTVQLSYTRQQSIYGNFMAIGQLSGQYASGPLFSAEEFGYGGQAFGRAYDPSEITGDHGIAASLELRYLGSIRGRESPSRPIRFTISGRCGTKMSAALMNPAPRLA